MSVSVHSFAIRRMFLNEMDPLIPHLWESKDFWQMASFMMSKFWLKQWERT
jgi:hypothetical protein